MVPLTQEKTILIISRWIFNVQLRQHLYILYFSSQASVRLFFNSKFWFFENRQYVSFGSSGSWFSSTWLFGCWWWWWWWRRMCWMWPLWWGGRRGRAGSINNNDSPIHRLGSRTVERRKWYARWQKYFRYHRKKNGCKLVLYSDSSESDNGNWVNFILSN